MTNPQIQQIGQVIYNKKPLAGLSENLNEIRFGLRISSEILRPALRNPRKGHIGPSFPFEFARLLK